MSAATGTILAISLGAGGAVTSYLGNRAQAKASERASAQLQQGVREAREYAEPIYNRAQEVARTEFERGRAGLDPYAQQGGQGLTALTALLGLPAAPAHAPVASAPAAAPAAAATPPAAAPPNPLGALLTESLQRRAAPAAPSSYVSLRAPTGDVRPVPADQVDFYLARGATRV